MKYSQSLTNSLRAARKPTANPGNVIGMQARAVLALLLVPAVASGQQALQHQDFNRLNEGTVVSPAAVLGAPLTATVSRLMGSLTLDEKIRLVHLTADPDNSKVGSVGYFPGVPRLGIPVRRDADALGIQVIAPATAIPSRIGLGASFDRGAAYAAGQLVGEEGRALGVDLVYAPQLDIARIPNWGRNNATYGEDPFLSGQLGIQDVAGIQSRGLMAQVKHFAFYQGQSGAEYYFPGNPKLPTVVDEQTAHELYLKPFEYAVREGQPSSVMASYQGFQITPAQSKAHWATANRYTLTTVLRDEWQFAGFTESDYGATHDVDALLAGLDQDSNPPVDSKDHPNFISNYFAEKLKPLVDPASPTYNVQYAKALDQAVARVLSQYERFGLLRQPSSEAASRTDIAPTMAALKGTHARVTEKLAEESAVLLKNEDSILPLSQGDLDSLAVIGPTAAQVMVEGGQPERARGFPDRDAISTLQMLRQLAPAAAKISYSPGIDWIGQPVPASAFSTLTRTEQGSGKQIPQTVIDYDLDTAGNDLKAGTEYTWTGDLVVPAADTYYLWVKHSWLEALFYPTHSVKLTIDGSQVPLVTPGVPTATYPAGFIPVNGTNEGGPVKLSPGHHHFVLEAKVPRIGYYPIDETSPIPVQSPITFKLTWSRLSQTIAAAVESAKAAKAVVLFVDDNGLPEDEIGIASHNIVEGVAQNQDLLIDAVTAANPRTVVVMSTGNPIVMPWENKAKAVLETWYPGQEGGTAIARLLLGLANPSGKTPISWPVDAAQTPFAGHPERVEGNGKDVLFSEDLLVGYRWYDQQKLTPRFPFGHGLSYTSFSYTDLNVHREADGVAVSFTLTNTGHVKGAEVPQVYLGPSSVPSGVHTVPRKLVGFERVELEPSEHRSVTLHISKRELSYWSTKDHEWVVPTERRQVFVGASSGDIRLHSSIAETNSATDVGKARGE